MSNELPLFRPSKVQTFGFCPQKYAFDEEGWVPKIALPRMVAASWSVAAHAGFALFHKLLLAGDTDASHRITSAAQAAAAEWMAEINHYTSYGVSFGTLDIEERRQQLLKLVTRYCEKSRLCLPGWKVLTVETRLDDFHCTPDIVAEDPDGLIVPVDWKVKYLKDGQSRWFDIDGWIDEFAYTSKQVYYTWAVGETFKRPCDKHYIYGIQFNPHDDQLTGFVIPKAYKAWWHEQYMIKLGRMEVAIEAAKAGFSWEQDENHKGPYGMCDMLNACTLYNRNPEQMALEYVRVPQRRESQREG